MCSPNNVSDRTTWVTNSHALTRFITTLAYNPQQNMKATKQLIVKARYSQTDARQRFWARTWFITFDNS
jgi:hypothetical protein